jgi:hypothetical protein
MAMRERLIFTMKKVFKETEEQVNLRYVPDIFATGVYTVKTGY